MKDGHQLEIKDFDWDATSKTLVFRGKLPMSEPLPKCILVRGEHYNLKFIPFKNEYARYQSIYGCDAPQAKGIKVVLPWCI